MPKLEDNLIGGAEILELRIQSLLRGPDGGIFLDLKEIYSEINIFEDLFTNTLSGNIIITDTLNLLSKMPIVGYEVVTIKYKTTVDFGGVDEDGIKSLTFRVSGISSRATTSNRKTEIYTITLVPEVFMSDLTRKVNKSYSGKLNTTIQNIFKSYVQPVDSGFSDLFPKPELEIKTDIANDYSCIIPGWSPFRSINWLLTRAFSSKNYSDVSFLMYQDSGSQNFVITTLNDLMDQNKISQMYYYGDVFSNQSMNTGERNRANVFNVAHNLEISETFNMLDNISLGLFAGVTYTHDLLKKQIVSKKYSYNDFVFTNKSHKEGKYAILPNDNELMFSSNSKVSFFSDRDSISDDGINQDVEKYPDRVFQRRSLFNQMQLFKISFTCLGDSTRKVGEKVMFVAPPLGSIDASTDNVWDKNLSGEYLITALHHKITLDQYQMVVELSRNYLASPIPSETKLEVNNG